jgi:putative Holliday junction resolvase
MTTNLYQTIIGLDIGEKRIGVARINTVAKIAEPLEVIETSNQDATDKIKELINEHLADAVVAGLPRGLGGQETDQTKYCQNFANQLAREVNVPVYMIDEAGTSKEADVRIGKSTSISRDSMAAAILLEDFVNYKDKELLRVGV